MNLEIYMYRYTYMTTINVKRVMNLKESKERYVKGLRGRSKKGEMI